MHTRTLSHQTTYLNALRSFEKHEQALSPRATESRAATLQKLGVRLTPKSKKALAKQKKKKKSEEKQSQPGDQCVQSPGDTKHALTTDEVLSR